jgi:hypothetical protein
MGFVVAYVEVSVHQPVYSEITVLKSFGIKYELNEAEKNVNEDTKIQGFAMKFTDYPFYSFEITATRL